MALVLDALLLGLRFGDAYAGNLGVGVDDAGDGVVKHGIAVPADGVDGHFGLAACRVGK